MLKTRIITALLLMPLVLFCLFGAGQTGWAAFCVFVCSLAGWEWGRLTGLDSRKSVVVGVGVLLAASLWVAFPVPSEVVLALDVFSLVFWCAVVPVWLKQKWSLAKFPLALPLGLLILLATLSGLIRWQALANGPYMLLAVLAIAWVADTAAYFSGRAFGKHKLAPSISPGKTWEGVVGALVAMAIYGVILDSIRIPLLSAISLPVLVVGLWLITTVSVIGDLLESLFKRQVGLKDSSNLLPGHGGVLDRIDSLLAVVPVASSLFSVAGLWK